MIYLKRIKSYIKNENTHFLLMISIYLCLELPFLTTIRPVMYDEAWYANTASNFSIGKGFLNSIVGSGANANFMLPLFTGIVFKFIGVSLFTARLVSVLSGLIFLLLMRKVFNLLSLDYNSQLISYYTVLFVPFFNTVFRFGRPECLALVFVIAAIYFYLKFLIYNNYISIVYISFFLLLAFLSHPFTSLFFLLIGIHLIIIAIRNVDLKLFKYLIFFSIIGVFALLIILLANSYYNNHSFDLINSMNDMFKRTASTSETPELLKDRIYSFSKSWLLSSKIIFSGPLILVVMSGILIKNLTVKYLSIISICYIIFSFFLFKNDLEMFPLIFDYFLVFSVIILPFVYEYLKKKNIKLTITVFLLFLGLNLSATLTYNIEKQENINTTLQRDFKQIIPDTANVFGPIRFWFFLPKTNYISDHYRLNFPEISTFDYVITNSVDEKIYANYSYFHKRERMFKLIYSTKSIQYGTIKVYKNTKVN
jgi:hypothetical protein